jgi:hypothetical protein
MASKDKTVDAKALMASIAKGWKLGNTPKVRAGFKAGQQRLVQSKDGKTLGSNAGEPDMTGSSNSDYVRRQKWAWTSIASRDASAGDVDWVASP